MFLFLWDLEKYAGPRLKKTVEILGKNRYNYPMKLGWGIVPMGAAFRPTPGIWPGFFRRSAQKQGGTAMGEVIAVLSGKGGTGKTSLCAGLATALAAEGRRVLCIDLDVGLRNLDIALGMQEVPALSFTDVSSGACSLEAAAMHPSYPNLFFLTAPVGLTPEEIDRKGFSRMLDQAAKEFDFCLLDAPAGLGAGFSLAAGFAHRVVLVTGGDPASLRDAGRTAEVLELMGKRWVRLAVNRVRPELFEQMAVNVDDMMDSVGLPLLGIVPEDRAVTLAAAFGAPLLRYSRRGAASAACQRMARRLMGQQVLIPKIRSGR